MTARLTREELLKKKAEDEARRAGTLPAEKDAHGRVINPHIPEFMKVAPWYIGDETVGLDHQRLPESQKYSSDIHAGWYERGKSTKVSSSSGGKPTCENCGATTHVTKNCLERPRKLGASKTGGRLAADDVAQPSLNLSYDGKRDVYNGFDVDAQLRAQQKKGILMSKVDVEESKDSAKKSDVVIPKGSLRVRSDTAKYLRNLDPDSAFYDPKTRSMRANPNPDVPVEQLSFAGDNFVRHTGDAMELEKMEDFAAMGEGQAVQANPTALALARKQFEERKARLAAERKQKIEEQYGANAAAPASAMPQVEASSSYVEYAPDGKVLAGSIIQPVTTSRFEEDVHERNHTQVWGSYFDKHSMSWGYACCWQTIRGSFCTGEAGKQAIRESFERSRPTTKTSESNSLINEKATSAAAAVPPPSMTASAMYGETSVNASFDQEKLKEALERAQQVSNRPRDPDSGSDWSTSSSESRSPKKHRSRRDSDDDSRREHKRRKKEKKHRKHSKKHKHRSSEEHYGHQAPVAKKDDFGRDMRETTPEDVEAYRLTRIMAGDPMADMLQAQEPRKL